MGTRMAPSYSYANLFMAVVEDKLLTTTPGGPNSRPFIPPLPRQFLDIKSAVAARFEDEVVFPQHILDLACS